MWPGQPALRSVRFRTLSCLALALVCFVLSHAGQVTILPGMNRTGQISHAELSKVINDGTIVDAISFRSLYDQHSPQLLAFLNARTVGRLSAEDVAADVWLKVIRNAHQFDGGHFRGWIFSIARTTLVDAVRKVSRENVSSADDVEIAAVDSSAEMAGREEELRALRDCIESVGGPFVAAVVSTKLHEVSPEDLAVELEVSRATVDSRVSRGKKLLSECLEGKQKNQHV